MQRPSCRAIDRCTRVALITVGRTAVAAELAIADDASHIHTRFVAAEK